MKKASTQQPTAAMSAFAQQGFEFMQRPNVLAAMRKAVQEVCSQPAGAGPERKWDDETKDWQKVSPAYGVPLPCDKPIDEKTSGDKLALLAACIDAWMAPNERVGPVFTAWFTEDENGGTAMAQAERRWFMLLHRINRYTDGDLPVLQTHLMELSHDYAAPETMAPVKLVDGNNELGADGIKPDPVALAVTLVKDHPYWSARKIAKEINNCYGTNFAHSTLTRSPLFLRAKALAQGKVKPPAGSKDADGNIEAIDDARNNPVLRSKSNRTCPSCEDQHGWHCDDPACTPDDYCEDCHHEKSHEIIPVA